MPAPVHSRVRLAAIALGTSLIAGSATAASIIVSTSNGATLGGLTFRDGDLVRYDTVANTATLFFDEDLFAQDEQVDAFQLLANGHLLLSTSNNATLGGLAFGDGDVVDYDPLADLATLLFAESLFSNAANVDGFQLLANGHYLISTAANETLGGLAFRDGDLVDYDPINDIATLFLAETIFTANENIDAFSLLPDGSVVLSTANSATFDAGLSILQGDLARYDPNTGTATLYLSGALFSATENIDAVQAPEPQTGALVAAGLLWLALAHRRARHA
jgi:hypothetical protein